MNHYNLITLITVLLPILATNNICNIDSPSFYPHQISRKNVNDYKPGQWIPECELLVEWDPSQKDKKPVRLRHRVNLIGARAPYNYFNLNLNPAWKGSSPLTL